MVEAMPHEQMGMFEAALACLYRVFQRHRPWQVTNQWTVKLPCFGGQPLVGIRTQPVVDLQRVDTTRAVRACPQRGSLRRERRVLEIEAGDLYEAWCGLLPCDGLPGPAALVGHAGDQRVGSLRAVHHVAGAGN